VSICITIKGFYIRDKKRGTLGSFSEDEDCCKLKENNFVVKLVCHGGLPTTILLE